MVDSYGALISQITLYLYKMQHRAKSAGARRAVRLDLPALDLQGAEDVAAEIVGGILPAAAFDQLQDAKVLSTLQGKAAPVDGDPVFDEPPQPVDPADRVQEEVVMRAPDQHFVEFGVRLKYLRTRHPLE